MMLTEQHLRAFLPKLNASLWASALAPACARFDIDTRDRLAAFLAQVAHESAEFTRLEENLNYSAKRLMQVWPKRFPTEAHARLYERKPEALANLVYAGRMGNGDFASGDGWRYHGRGLIQLTGKGNYLACGTVLGFQLVAEPARLLEPEIASLSAAWFWQSRGCNELADDESDDDDDADFVRITKIINGGTNGLADRRAYWQRAQTALR